jgi:hypothetical protein
MSIKSILEKLLPFLFSAAQKEYDKLNKESQTGLLHGLNIGQIIKENLDAAETDIVNIIVAKTGLDADEVGAALQEIGDHYGITDGSIITYLQTELKAAQNVLKWKGILNTFANIAAIVLSGGSLTWEKLAMGLLQFAYEKFVKPKQV